MARGFFPLDRGVREKLACTLRPLERLLVQDLMALVNHAKGSAPARIPGERGRRCLRAGEMVTDCASLAQATGLSARSVRRALAGPLRELPWLMVRSVQGFKGLAGVHIVVDSAAAVTWATHDRPTGPVSRERDRPARPVTAERPATQAAETGQPGRIDRPHRPISGEEKRMEPGHGGSSHACEGAATAATPTSAGEAATPTSASTAWPALRALESVTHGWNGASNRRTRQARMEVLRSLTAEPTRVIAHALDIARASGVHAPWGVLWSRVRANSPADDPLVDEAARLMRGEGDRGQPEHIAGLKLEA